MSKPYVYIIEFKELGKRYIGVRYAKGCDKAELLQPGGYFTSSKVVRCLLSEGYTASIAEIIEFDTAKEAVAQEAKMIEEVMYSDNNDLLNIHCPGTENFYFDCASMPQEYKDNAIRKMRETKMKQSPEMKQEIRKKRDESIGDRKDEIYEKISNTLIERYRSGDLSHLKHIISIKTAEVMKGTLSYFDIFTGQSGRCDVDDPLVLIRKFPVQMQFLKDTQMISEMKRNAALYLLSNNVYVPPTDADIKHIVRESSIAVCRYHHQETGETNLFVYGYSYPDWVLGKRVREGKFRKVRDKKQCPNCEEMIATGVAYDRHVKACTSLGDDYKVKCPHCGVKTPKSKSRRLHFDNCSSITGVKAVRSNVGKKLDMKECPHCGFVGATNIVSRYHMDNCEVVTGKKRQNKHEIKECPHCGKKGAAGLMTRYHFNNCKHKPTEGL